MARFYVLFLHLLFFITTDAQPMIDLVNIKYSQSPDGGLIRRNNQHATFDHLSINLNLPFIFKKDSSAIVFSPFTEIWNIEIAEVPFVHEQFQSLALQTSFIKPVSQNWTITLSAIPRWNGYNGHWFNNSFQMGGAFLASYRKTSMLKYKIGIYYNSEFSGAFVIPLLGVDWRVNANNNIFGVLPGNLSWEHKASQRIYYGVVFRAVTNSYRSGFINNQSYFMRIDDNQLSLYADLYVAKKIVLTVEAGHSVLRKIRFGYKGGDEKYFYKNKVNDNLLFRAALAYRLRLL